MSGIIVINQKYYIGSNIFVLTYNELKKNIITLCRKVLLPMYLANGNEFLK